MRRCFAHDTRRGGSMRPPRRLRTLRRSASDDAEAQRIHRWLNHALHVIIHSVC